MFKILGKIPKDFYLACSGGTDSMIFLDFLMKYPKNKITVLHFDHGTSYCKEAHEFMYNFCIEHKLSFVMESIPPNDKKQKEESWEVYWRRCRYNFLSQFKDKPIVMCHQLNDCIETWVMTSMTGIPRLIPYHNSKYNIIRPFLCVSKKQIDNWKKNHNVKCVIDGSNYDIRMKRNFVRHVMMKDIYTLNPGIEKTVRKLILYEYEEMCHINILLDDKEKQEKEKENASN